MVIKSLKNFINQQGWEDFGLLSYEDLVGDLKVHKKIFEKWIDKGFSADMNYLRAMKEDRYQPRNKLPDIKTVIVLTAWYGYEQKICSKKEGSVARYAGGKDYHKQLKKKLIELSNWLKSQAEGVETYVSVDSGPTVDRVLAESAGIGFFGKNACLINPSKGSYFFIASLYINQKIQSTEKKVMPNCGNCQKCSVACPTGALVGPGQLDARKCISYLTIENKRGIPLDLRPKIGNRLFGCDICQEVCPFNSGRAHRQEIKIEKLKGEYGVGGQLDLREILMIESDKDYLDRFAGTPLMRTKRRGLIRNACVVAGNSGDLSIIPYLEKVLHREEDEMLKDHAKWAINHLIKNKRPY